MTLHSGFVLKKLSDTHNPQKIFGLLDKKLKKICMMLRLEEMIHLILLKNYRGFFSMFFY